jgi:hypothetical protein
MGKACESTVIELFLAQFDAGGRRALAHALDRAGAAARESVSWK